MNKKRVLSLLMAIVMVVALMPINVFAAVGGYGTLTVKYYNEQGQYIGNYNTLYFSDGDEIDTSKLTLPSGYVLSTSKTGFWYGDYNSSSNYKYSSSNVYLHSYTSGSGKWSTTYYKFTKSSADTTNAIPKESSGATYPTATVIVYVKQVTQLNHVDVRVNLTENVTTWVNGVSSTSTKNYTIAKATDVSIKVNGKTYTNPTLRTDGTAKEFNFNLSSNKFVLDDSLSISINASITDQQGQKKEYTYTPDYTAILKAAANCPGHGTSNAGLDFDLEANTIITNNTSSSVVMNFVDQGGNTVKTTTSNPYEYGTTYSETGVLPEGYELVDPSVLLTVSGTMGAGNVICTFTVKPISYNITYDLAGGTNSVNNPATYTIEDSIIFEEATKAGFAFGGWYKEASFVNKVASIPVGSTGAKTLYAKWTENDITINYVAVGGGGVNKDSETLKPSTGTAGGATATANSGHEFIGWSTSSTATTAADCITTSPHYVPSKVGGAYQAATYYAIFVEKDVTITYIAGEHGKVSRDSETIKSKKKTAAGSTAIPDAGYHFVSWKNAAGTTVGTDAVFVPAKNSAGLYETATYYADFEEDAHVTITYEAGNGGSVGDDSDTINPVIGTPSGSTATANAGYVFLNWTDANGNEVGADEIFVPSKINGKFAAATYTANFVEAEDVTISYTAGIGGSVSSDSEDLAPVTGEPDGSTAIPDAGYHFVSWKNAAGTTVGTDAVFVPAKNSGGLYETVTYYASFAEDVYVTITYEAGNGGSVGYDTDTINPVIGTPVGSEATANAGYVFLNWTDADGNEVGTDEIFVPSKINGKFVTATYRANFVEDEDVTISYTAGTGGSVSSESEQVAPVTGEAAGSTAIPDAGYHFVSWKNAGGTIVGTDETFVPAKNSAGLYETATYYADFEEDAHVTITYEAGNGGSVGDDSDTINPVIGTPVGSEATANAGYVFLNWTDANGNEVGTDEIFVPSKTNGKFVTATYTANFVEDEEITIYYTAGTGGSVSSESEQVAPVTGIPDGSTATADTGYVFLNWTDANGYEVGTDEALIPSKTSELFASATYTANFVEDEDVTIYYTAGTGGSVSSDSEQVSPVTGEATGSTASASAGYVFFNWTDAEGNEVGTDETFVPQQSDNGVYTAATYTANFTENASVTVTYVASTGGTIGDIVTGEAVSQTTEDIAPATGTPSGAVAANLTGYTFFNWTNSNGDEVGTSYKFTPSKAQGVYVADTYKANFKPKYHNFVVEDIYNDMNGEEIDELHSITGNDSGEKVAFGSEISSAKNEYLRGYEYSDMIVYVDEEKATDAELAELGVTVDRENGTLTGTLPDHQIWVKYIYNEVEKYRVDYTSEGKVTGMPDSITDALPGDEITISTAVPIRDGFTFIEWRPEINEDPIEVTEGKFIMHGGNVEIRAVWEANEEVWNYDVKYYTEDGKLITTIPSTVLKSDPIVTTVENKAPEGYKLQGYTFNGGEMTRELSAEITEDGQTIAVYYEKNDLIVKHVYGTTTVYDSNQSKTNLSVESGNVVVNAVTSGRYSRILSAALNNNSLGGVTAVTVVPNGESKYEVVFTYGIRSSSDSDDNSYTPSNPGSSDSTPGDDVTIIEDPAVALQDGLESIDHFAYVFGYEDGTVRPENKVTREEVATIFYRLLTDGTRDALFTKEQNFPDVSSSRWSNVAIATLLNGKIVSGYPDGEFKPGNYITRAEFAAIVAKFDNLSYSGDNKFSDIYAHWAANYINSAAIKGWISGYPDGTFHPDAYISRAEAITLINAVLGRQVSKDGLLPEAKYWSDNTPDKWYYEAVMEATNSHDYDRETDSNVEKWTALKDDKIWTER
ncbi:MAG: S-layer homology domain-containing protein [Lachnospiraceae bacterium]|nr:S-layer homology domain-containing protein [Lachnospiraceae bacterium]